MRFPHHDYLSITGQKIEYEKCIDNYTEKDFTNNIQKERL